MIARTTRRLSLLIAAVALAVLLYTTYPLTMIHPSQTPHMTNHNYSNKWRTEFLSPGEHTNSNCSDTCYTVPPIPPSQTPSLYNLNYTCSDKWCTEFLSPEYTGRCEEKYPECVFLKSDESCHFMNGTNRAPVALASYPGGGNTWVRGLLEQATGICTGSLYCDPDLKESGFIGEGYKSGAVIVVKTHDLKPSWANSNTEPGNGPPWGSAIFIIRNPRDVLVAEWNRLVASHVNKSQLLLRQNGTTHTNYVDQSYFGHSKPWEYFLKNNSAGWAEFFKDWVLSAAEIKRPILVVKYENIKIRKLEEVERMLKFLGVLFSREDLKQRMSEGFETFHRTHPKEFEHFTSEQEQYVREQVKSLIALLKIKNNGCTLGVEEYLEPTA